MVEQFGNAVGSRCGTLSLGRLAWRGFCFWWRAHVAVGLGLATAVAVLTGAFILADSLRGTLTDLALRRLGPVSVVLGAGRLFPAEVIEQLNQSPGFAERFASAVPIALFTAAIRFQPQEISSKGFALGGVEVIACDGRFWRLFGEASFVDLSPDEIVLGPAVARQFTERVGRPPQPGDRVTLRVLQGGDIPPDTPLGQKRFAGRPIGFRVRGVLSAEGAGAFSLRQQQWQPKTVFVALEALGWLDRYGHCNTVLLVERAEFPGRYESVYYLRDNLPLDPAVAGLKIEETSSGYFLITHEGYFIPPTVAQAVEVKLANLRYQPVFTYLANQIRFGDRVIPYSLIAGVDPEVDPPLGPLVTADGKPLQIIPPDAIVLNDWAAADLGVKLGDRIVLRYFLPEGQGGTLRETEAELSVAEIVRLAGAAADPLWTPQIPGVTEKKSIRDWDAPFEPFHPEWIRLTGPPGPGNDEDYWHRYGTTPKGFVSLETARRLWGSRFGHTTGFRMAPQPTVETVGKLRERLRLRPDEAGLAIEPVRAEALRAATGTTSFTMLFLGFSAFILAAGMILAVLFVSLTLAQRSRELGLLAALGFSPQRIRRLLFLEFLFTIVVGGVTGVVLSWAYCQVFVYGLHTVWIAVVGEPIVRLHFQATSLVLGVAIDVVVAAGSFWWLLRGYRHFSPTELLRASAPVNERRAVRGGNRWFGHLLIVAVIVIGAGLLIAAGWQDLSAQEQAAWFFGAAVCFLVAGFLILRALVTPWRHKSRWLLTTPTLGMACLSLRRNPQRTLSTCAIFALAIFVLVAVSVFRLHPGRFAPGRHPGSGGYAFIVETALPVLRSLDDRAVLEDFFSAVAPSGAVSENHLPVATESLRVRSFRMRTGQDASCLNLYRVKELTVLGVSDDFIDENRFPVRPWVRCTDEEKKNPWRLLRGGIDSPPDQPMFIPAFVDETTAVYALGLSRRGHPLLTITDGWGRGLIVRVVGVLQESIFQGQVLIHEEHFRKLYPNVPGYRFFLVECSEFPEHPGNQAQALLARTASVLEEAFGDYGGQVEITTERLTRFAQVQNTYLAIFQSLGGLGLLLGAAGLGAVQLRNVFERSRELALLRAVGFPPSKLINILLTESILISLLGLVLGLVPAQAVVLPSLWAGRATVPWLWLVVTIAITIFAGLTATVAAVVAFLRIPFLQVLRRE